MSAAAARLGRGRLRQSVAATGFVLLALLLEYGAGVRVGTVALAAIALLVAAYRQLFAWRNLLVGLIAVILFIPVGLYSLPGHLPFALEPYRLYVALLLALWLSSLLIDRRVRLRMGLLGGLLLVLLGATLASDLVNPGRVHAVGSIPIKRLTFFASFVLVYFVVVSLVRHARDLDFLVRVMVGGGSVLACFALVEYASGFNVFNHLTSIVPLQTEALPYSLGKHGGERLRVVASSQDPIALGALFAMLLPLSVYAWSATRQRRWWLAAMLLLLGTFTTQSRTAIVMLVVVFIVFLRLRPHAVKRLWPLALPALLAVHLAVPGSIGSLKGAFFPKGGVIAQQESGAGTYGSGRLADVGPSLSEFAQHPVFGEGFGTRVTDIGPLQNANILDDQWLGTLLEIGIVGALVLVATFSRVVGRLMRAAREDPSPRGWLCAGLAAAIFAYAVGMFTYDAFSFIQVTITMFILLAFGALVLGRSPEKWRAEMEAA